MARVEVKDGPTGARIAPGDGVEVVLHTSGGEVRVVQTWEGWEMTLLLLLALRLELKGVKVISQMTGEVCAFMNDARPILTLPKRGE